MKPWIVIAAVISPALAHAETVSAKIVDVAGGIAYIEPGAAAGIVVGTKLTIGPNERTITAASSTTASFELRGLVVNIGQTVTAEVVAHAAQADVAKRAPVHDEATFREQWPAPAHPADAQHVKAVPLGAATQPGAIQLTVLGQGYASASRDVQVAQAEARVITSFAVTTDKPFAIDGDVAVRTFSDGYNKAERTPLFVRAAQLRYGDAIDPNVVVGRLRWAASSIGMLDGGRAMTRFGAFEIAAFGGIVPDGVSGHVETSASRFGAEAIYDLADHPWQPRVAVTASGSTWQGALDEQRVSLAASATHGNVTLDGWGDAQGFSANNPWGAHTIELTGAGLSASWRDKGDHVGLDASYLTPERSLRLASLLPADWLCARVPEAGVTAERCAGGDYWADVTATGGIRRGMFVLDGAATIGRTHDVEISTTGSAYLRSELHFGERRLIVAGSAGRAAFATWDSGELGLGSAFGRAFDLELRYRAEILDYVAATQRMLLHAIAADARYSYSSTFDLAVSLLGTTGDDRKNVAGLLTVAWRPLP
ncbi:MAG: hypothetical protein QM831_11190 [Kofleriaceae bacterium]